MNGRTGSTRLAIAAATAAIGLAASGCSAGDSKLSKGDLQKKVGTLVKQETGKEYTITCPGDLKAKVGATERCAALGADKSTLALVVTVDKVDGNKVNFRVEEAGSASTTTAPSTT